ncbi:apoptosis regulatory protein Siva [Rhinatrema bivittatum]|uniref:apoptosis regulatory protein Siva n=1 Tax=Rhinatrema bivittatum TaxID=194408 RepID=UPI0011273F82|nr:apoptosis regulatory protein Siva [Rhinatrema bivittatum]XP_029453931.1 apoptosis regulatory protein Siva [Rhinatrema bivittatum]
MPKRSFPFGDGAPLQLKMRVGPKELCDGVFGEKYKREIFEKTKKLLFSGAQAFMGGTWSGAAAAGCPEAAKADCAAGRGDLALLHGQTRIGRDGKLLRGSRSPRKLTSPMGVSKACTSCVRSVGDNEACTQCERFVCQNCSKMCSSCNASTCSLCSVDESGFGEKIFCNDCSMFER